MAREKDIQKDIEAIRADIAALSDTLGRLASAVHDARSTMRDSMKTAAKDAAKETAGAGEELFADTVKLGSDTADAAVSSLDAIIRRNPITAVLTALGIGFLLGMMGRR